MDKILVSLENCYGIRKLDYEFDFKENSPYIIYAPNGVMKTSLAKTFKDLSQNKDSEDSIYKDRVCSRSIVDETGASIASENIFVITPYERSFQSEKMSTLLVNRDLKSQYEAIYASIDDKKGVFLNVLKSLSGIKKIAEIETSLARDVVSDEKFFFNAIISLSNEIKEAQYPSLQNIVYNDIFNSKILPFIQDPLFISQLTKYIARYNSLIEDSNFFKRGVFNHYNATTIASNLQKNGFFKANHTVTLKTDTGKEERLIENDEQLETVINEEKERILNDPELRKEFDKIDKLIKNEELRNFREFLVGNPTFLVELNNLPALRRRLWISYIQQHKDIYDDLVQEVNSAKLELSKISAAAKDEQPKWRDVIDTFNDRFSVPFTLSVDNQEDVILRSDVPIIKFTFQDEESSTPVNEKELLDVLSKGELRALYLLNIIFEVEARVHNNIETIYIVDDIADSFDYKNKYAIIEYLKDISKNKLFKEIILTHNYDFYRTVASRLEVHRDNKLYSERSRGKIILKPEKYQHNPFKTWKNSFGKKDKDMVLIASIPFVRNLADYSGDKENYAKLTSLLHIKTNSSSITVSDLEGIYKSVLKDQGSLMLPNGDRSVIEVIYNVADSLQNNAPETVELESKIALAIAIRLKAEEYMIPKINDDAFLEEITLNQTAKLIKRYKESYPNEKTNIKTLNEVNLMTPENIHLNSFMYEPILDMSNHHLITLYSNISMLNK